jgi:hypothetical protein
LPSAGKMLADQIGEADAEATERSLQEGDETRLY